MFQKYLSRSFVTGFFYTYTNKIASNLSKLLHFVGKKGLEPLSLAALVPKTSAYTNSATCPYSNLSELYTSTLTVPPAGFEPATVCLRGNCSTN